MEASCNHTSENRGYDHENGIGQRRHDGCVYCPAGTDHAGAPDGHQYIQPPAFIDDATHHQQNNKIADRHIVGQVGSNGHCRHVDGQWQQAQQRR